jgi:hypothetical protein
VKALPRILALIYAFGFLAGCKSITSCFLIELEKNEPTIEDTKFDESKRDWVAVFEHEIKAAMENEDEGAYHFFMHELLKEKVRLWKEKHNKLENEKP